MRRRHTLGPLALVLSMLALALALGTGAGYAAGLIGTAQFKDGAVTSAKIKDKTIATADVAAGVHGASGDRGAQGAAGIPTAVERTAGAVSLPSTGGTQAIVLGPVSVPAGVYTFLYRADVVSFESVDPAHAYYRCSVQAAGTQVGAATTYAHTASPALTVSQMTVADTLTLSATTSVRVLCSHDNATTGKPYVENQRLILLKSASVDAATATPPADSTGPALTLSGAGVSVAPGGAPRTVTVTAPTTFTASASDPESGVARTEIWFAPEWSCETADGSLGVRYAPSVGAPAVTGSTPVSLNFSQAGRMPCGGTYPRFAGGDFLIYAKSTNGAGRIVQTASMTVNVPA